MSGPALWLYLAAFAVAVVDWLAVAADRRPLEYVAKPLTMVVLVAATLALDPVDGAMRAWFVVALTCSLAGDVFLMLPDSKRWFVPGLASFLAGHVAYIVGLVTGGVSAVGLAVGLVVVAAAVALVAPRVVLGARRTDPRLATPVSAYVAVISVMVVCATGTMVPAAIGGALLFYLSDLAIGWSRFVSDFTASRVVIITTYHAAQLLLVASLLVAR